MIGKDHKIGHQEYQLLCDISTRSVLWGFLTSASSTRRMCRNAHEREQAKQKAQERRVYRARLANLERKNLIQFTNQENGYTFVLTKKGQEILRKSQLIEKLQKKQKTQWDGYWRMVAFDIPQEYSRYRHGLRRLLKDCGFVQIQQSVYVFPYSCRELVAYVSKQRTFGTYIHFFKGNYIGNDSRLKKHFKLPH